MLIETLSNIMTQFRILFVQILEPIVIVLLVVLFIKLSNKGRALFLTAVSISFVPLLFLLPPLRRTFFTIMLSISIPSGASNGEWAQRAVEEGHPSLFSTIEEMADTADHIVRGEIVNVRSGTVIHRYGVNISNIYSFYSFRVLEVYSGSVAVDTVINLLQVSRVSHRKDFSQDPVEISYISEHLSVGDELVLFLRPQMTALLTPYAFSLYPIQGAYRYTPSELRDSYENWVFESVNEHNNLIFTERDLLAIINS